MQGNSPYPSHSPCSAAFLGLLLCALLPALQGTALLLVHQQGVLADATGFSLGVSVAGQTETPDPAQHCHCSMMSFFIHALGAPLYVL